MVNLSVCLKKKTFIFTLKQRLVSNGRPFCSLAKDREGVSEKERELEREREWERDLERDIVWECTDGTQHRLFSRKVGGFFCERKMCNKLLNYLRFFAPNFSIIFASSPTLNAQKVENAKKQQFGRSYISNDSYSNSLLCAINLNR